MIEHLGLKPLLQEQRGHEFAPMNYHHHGYVNLVGAHNSPSTRQHNVILHEPHVFLLLLILEAIPELLCTLHPQQGEAQVNKTQNNQPTKVIPTASALWIAKVGGDQWPDSSEQPCQVVLLALFSKLKLQTEICFRPLIVNHLKYNGPHNRKAKSNHKKRLKRAHGELARIEAEHYPWFGGVSVLGRIRLPFGGVSVLGRVRLRFRLLFRGVSVLGRFRLRFHHRPHKVIENLLASQAH
mmetsp:Transcript_8890/g.16819  ORF Transcript_8890/g.16819 Transcript_8890/m.16819 type:complete len:239 (+) Transcript_8890:1662-2378(+)